MISLILSLILSLITLPGNVDDAVATVPSYRHLQQIELKRFEQQNNLSNPSIKTIVRDKTGFLWIGTQNGLNRYDGTRIVQYFADPNNPNALNDNYIQSLFIDSDGDLWILVPGTFLRYNPKTDDFTRFQYTDEKKNTHTSNPGAIVQDQKGIIWLGTPEQGLYSFDKNTGKFEFRPVNSENIDFMVFDDKHNLWIGSPGKVYVYNIAANTYKELEIPGNEVVVTINPSARQLITRNKVFRININDNAISFEESAEKPPFISAEILCVLESKDFLWFGTRGKGLLQYSKKDRTFSSQQLDRYSYFSISDNTIRSMYEDKYGIVWLGTENGLNMIFPDGNKFSHYSNENSSLTSNLIYGFAEDKNGIVWIPTYNGVTLFNPKDKTFEQLYDVSSVDGGNINLSNVRDVAVDEDGTIWLMLKGSVVKYNPEARNAEQYKLRYKDIEANDLLTIFYDKGKVWIGTYGFGVFVLDAATGKVEKVMNNDNSQISSDYIKDIIPLGDGTIAIATLRTGLDIYNTKTSKFKNISFSDRTQNYVSDYINSIFKDSKGRLWVLSWHGIFVLDQNANIFKSFFIEDGLPSNEMNAIAEDNYNSIWIGTDNGLSRIFNYDTDDFHISTYKLEDGLAYNSISTGCLYSTNDGKFILVGTPSGLDIFNNDIAPNANKSEPPMIVGLKIFGQEVRPGEEIEGRIVIKDPIYQLDKIKLSHNQNNITIIFSSWDFNKLHSRRYAYKLDGIDKDWIYTDSRGEAIYNNLRPGKYVFHVKTMNLNGTWSEETLLNIIVMPPWWQSWWAIIIYVLAFLTACYMVYRFLINRERIRREMHINKIEREKENEIYEIKQQLYTNITHDMRTALTLISGPVTRALKNDEIPDNVKEGLGIVEKNTGYLKSLIDQVLDFRKIEVGLVKPKVAKVELAPFLKGVTQMFSTFAQQKNIKLICEVDQEAEFVYFDKSMFSKILYNLISNAIKFTPEGGEVRVIAKLVNNRPTIMVKDSGIGMESSRIPHIFEEFYQIYPSRQSDGPSPRPGGSGIGLSIVKKYVDLHNAQIEVTSSPGQGATFTITLQPDAEWVGNIIEDDNTEQADLKLPEMHLETLDQSHLTYKKDEIDIAADEESKDTVLIVDDNADIISYLKSCLKEHFRVICAYNGRVGYEIAVRELPDVIVSDVMMPEVDGFGFARSLKENVLTSHIPILFLTAKTSREDAMRGLQLGAIDYLTKPFNEDILIAKISNLISDRNNLRLDIKRRLEEQGTIVIDKTNLPDDNRQDEASPVENVQTDPFLQKILDFIDENIENPELSMTLIQEHFNLGRMQLYRKLKAVSDLTASDLIREIRMKKAKELLEENKLNISEIAYKLNFTDPFYFSNSFKKKYGVSPTEYRKNQSAK